MHWEVEVSPVGEDRSTDVLRSPSRDDVLRSPAAVSRVYLLDGELNAETVERIAAELLTDPVVERFRIQPQLSPQTVTILPKPGVMDPVAQSVEAAIRDLGFPPVRVRTGRRFLGPPNQSPQDLIAWALKEAANDAIEEVHLGPLPSSVWLSEPPTAPFHVVQVPLREADDADLLRISREGQLSLSLAEMKAIQEHFRFLGREPTDVELETLAQTWSEHCSHKTLKGAIADERNPDHLLYRNLLKETIFHATQEIRRQLGSDDWCVSVFVDNAGVVRFSEGQHVCFKVETHNHPSAIEPYGGANTGLGGVIRDVLGTGLGGKPICNTDVFCFAPPDYPLDQIPPGVLPPRRVQQGVVAGVRDYGNRMGIPTVSGAICYHPRYLANPLVFCGTVGLIPAGKEFKRVQPGDLIVAVGGRTGRDGIHGATFSSAELTHQSEQLSGGAVQIGNAITEKKLLDVLLQARDLNLYHAITDCGAGGFSSAIGEMGADMGAEVHLDRAPLKYAGLTYCEIWISEAQERMVLAVPPEHWPSLKELCDAEEVEATVLGTFVPTGRLRLFYHGTPVADLDMHFLHEGRPAVVRKVRLPEGGGGETGGLTSPARQTGGLTSPARQTGGMTSYARQTGGLTAPARQTGGVASPARRVPHVSDVDHKRTLLKLLGSWNICSKEAVIRQYDHEVQGGTVIKPLVGATLDGPGDAAVVTPILGCERGIALGCGINPFYGEVDPYWMAASAVDEAVRNVVAVGADPSRVALLDNFCWGNTERPEVLGSLVRAAEACRDVALAYGTPFISGKDSLNNEFKSDQVHLVIPPTLLISALGQVPNVQQCVTMDLKSPGNYLFLIGKTDVEFGGSHFGLVMGQPVGVVPRVDFEQAPRIFAAIHHAIRQGWLRACHDLSEGGLAVAVAEMAFAGNYGAVAFLDAVPLSEQGRSLSPDQQMLTALYAESNTRFLCEVPPEHAAALEDYLEQVGLPFGQIGWVVEEPRLRIYDREEPRHHELVDVALAELKEAWQKPLREL
ncbi:MAG: AIR synthase-related protein [Gemmatales bacterium]|nr:AIR synthase-related protein [Gemmatales bacterium]MDW8388238.1 AIR synthase-related protein [Gemmatales bacterium]